MWCPTNPPTGKRPFSPLPAKLIPVWAYRQNSSSMHVVVKARSLFIKNQGPEASRLDRGLSVWLNPARYHRIKFKLESRSSPELSFPLAAFSRGWRWIERRERKEMKSDYSLFHFNIYLFWERGTRNMERGTCGIFTSTLFPPSFFLFPFPPSVLDLRKKPQ